MYKKPDFYLNFKHKEKYVGIRFKDPATIYANRWKVKKRYIYSLLKIYDGITKRDEIKRLERKIFKYKSNGDMIERWSVLLTEYFNLHYSEKLGKKVNIYTVRKLLIYYDKWKLWKYFGKPMINASDFTDTKYFNEYKEVFNKHNKGKFIIW